MKSQPKIGEQGNSPIFGPRGGFCSRSRETSVFGENRSLTTSATTNYFAAVFRSLIDRTSNASALPLVMLAPPTTTSFELFHGSTRWKNRG